jgi:uncharacterized protein
VADRFTKCAFVLPLPPTVSPAKPVVWPSFVAFAIAFIGLSFASTFVIGLAAALRVSEGSGPTGDLSDWLRGLVVVPWVLTTSVAISSVGMTLVAVIGARLSKQPIAVRLRVGIAGTPMIHTALLLVAVLSVGQISGWLATLTGSYETSILAELSRSAREMPLGWFVALVVFGSLGAGLGEELFFRGFIQTQLRERWGRWAAIGITAALFGAVHADLVHTPIAFLMGVMLGWGAELRGNIRPVIVVHVLNNLLSFLQSRFLPGSEEEVHPAWIAGAAAIGLAAIAGLRAVNRAQVAPT